MPLRILTSDLLIADVNIRLADNPQMQALLDKYGWKAGSKNILSKEQFREFSEAATGCPLIPTPGGSSANTLTTLCKLLGRDVEGRFIGVVGEGQYSHMIRKSLTDAAIKLVPDQHADEAPQVAVSYVLVSPDGERTIATYPGNAKDVIKAGSIKPEMVADSDVVFVQGSLWEKFDREFADRLLQLRHDYGKQLWIALPTHAPHNAATCEHFRFVIGGADVVLSNGEELAHTYQVKTAQEALLALQKVFIDSAKGGYAPARQVGFITLDRQGAAVVTKDHIFTIPPHIAQREIVNKVGAGDTAFAGFLAGYVKQVPNAVAGRIGVCLAEEKLRYHGARLPDPLGTLQSSYPHLMDDLLNRPHASSRVGAPVNCHRPH